MFSAFHNNIEAGLYPPGQARHVVHFNDNKPAPVTLSDKMLWTETLSLPSNTLCLCSDLSDEDKPETKRTYHCFSFISLSEVRIKTQHLYNSIQTSRSSSAGDRSVDSCDSHLRQTESFTCTLDMAGAEAPAEGHGHHSGQVSLLKYSI